MVRKYPKTMLLDLSTFLLTSTGLLLSSYNGGSFVLFVFKFSETVQCCNIAETPLVEHGQALLVIKIGFPLAAMEHRSEHREM